MNEWEETSPINRYTVTAGNTIKAQKQKSICYKDFTE